MPLFKFVGRGSFITAKQGVILPGGTVEMTDAEAASLPSGTVVSVAPVLSLDAGRVEKPLLLVAPPPPVAPVGVVKPNTSQGSRRAKDTKP